MVVTSIGGLLGDEWYELRFMNGKNEQTFFRGANFSEFSAEERGKKFSIHLCNGWIDRAELIGVGQLENSSIVRLNLDWNCSDKKRET